MSSEDKETNEIRLDGGQSVGRSAWMDALAELEKPATPAVQPAPAPSPRQGRVRTALDDLDEVCAKIDKARSTLQAFVDAHPYLIAPNVYRMWLENMQESRITIERHVSHVRHRQAGGA